MVKVISLSDEAYTVLKSLKMEKDSFSDVVLKLTKKENKKSLLEFAGLWKDMPEMGRIFTQILKERHKSRDRKIDVNLS